MDNKEKLINIFKSMFKNKYNIIIFYENQLKPSLRLI